MGVFDGITDELEQEEREKQAAAAQRKQAAEQRRQTVAQRRQDELQARCRQVKMILEDYAVAAGQVSRRKLEIQQLIGLDLFGRPKTRKLQVYRMLVGEGYFYRELEARLRDPEECSAAPALQRLLVQAGNELYIDPQGQCYLAIRVGTQRSDHVGTGVAVDISGEMAAEILIRELGHPVEGRLREMLKRGGERP